MLLEVAGCFQISARRDKHLLPSPPEKDSLCSKGLIWIRQLKLQTPCPAKPFHTNSESSSCLSWKHRAGSPPTQLVLEDREDTWTWPAGPPKPWNSSPPLDLPGRVSLFCHHFWRRSFTQQLCLLTGLEMSTRNICLIQQSFPLAFPPPDYTTH